MAEADSSEPRDRLSELPDELIHLILSFLYMTDDVNTTLLSKRWNNLWTTLPFLSFRPRSYDSDSFKTFVNRTLESWKGTKILKFRLNFMICDSIPSDVDSWQLFAIEKQVEDLSIDFFGYTQFEPHHRLYSCSSLRKLSLVCFELKEFEESVQWNRLKSLEINVKKPMHEDVMNKVISGAPLLEILDLRILESNDNLNIESTSLKILKIRRHLNSMGNGGKNSSMLRISAPNLETLDILGISYDRYLWNILCLTNAVLCLSVGDYYLNERYSGDKLLELKRLFLRIGSGEKLKML